MGQFAGEEGTLRGLCEAVVTKGREGRGSFGGGLGSSLSDLCTKSSPPPALIKMFYGNTATPTPLHTVLLSH